VLKEMTLEGVVSILEGMNPRMIEIKLESFLAPPRAQGKGPVEVKKGEHETPQTETPRQS
jgi:chemotaxis protein MotA